MNGKRKLLVAGMVIGAALTASPLLGLLGTVLGMMRAFKTLGATGISDPQQLSHSIGITLISSAAGLALCPIGVILLAICLVIYNRDRKATPPPMPAVR